MMRRWPFARRTTALAPQEAYALWARDYPAYPHNALMEAEHQTLLSLLPDVQGMRSLDAGCGSGRYLRELKARGAVAFGVDLSAAMLGEAQRTECPLVRADLLALPFVDASIDLIVCGLALGDVDGLAQAIAELARVLRPGGRLLYSVVHPSGQSRGWQRTFDADGRQWAVDGCWHSEAEHRHACAVAELAIEEWRDATVAATPAALVVRARRG
jgi:malonyl-CoA O-methyltransferase